MKKVVDLTFNSALLAEMALLDNPSAAAHTMYSNMMTSSYLLHHHQNQATPPPSGRINPEWIAAGSPGSQGSSGLSPIIEDVRVARVAPSQRLSSGSSGSGSNVDSSPPGPPAQQPQLQQPAGATNLQTGGFKPYAIANGSSPDEKTLSKV